MRYSGWTSLSNVNNLSIYSTSKNTYLTSATIANLWTQNETLSVNQTGVNDAVALQITDIIQICLVSFMALMTIAGNSLVIIAFIYESTIRTYSNYFILNLSIADLLIGLICIPLYAPNFILGKWYLGYHLCKLWLVFDFVVGSASTLCIVVISYDRYQMVSKGLAYVSKTKIKRALKFMIGTWIIAILNYGPAIVLWDLLPHSDAFDYHKCDPPFKNNFPYLVTTAFVEFFVPSFSLIYLNLSIYLNIRRRSRGLIRTNTIRLKSNGDQSLTCMDQSLTSEQELPVSTQYSKTNSLARDRKAAKNLFILVFAFVICWCPYTLLSLIRALCSQGECISSTIYEITFWLLWLNSTINPLLYSFLHVKFREAFSRILCFYKHKPRYRVRTGRN